MNVPVSVVGPRYVQAPATMCQATSKLRPSSVQAMSKLCPSYVQAMSKQVHFMSKLCFEAREKYCVYHISRCAKVRPSTPLYNINKDYDEIMGSKKPCACRARRPLEFYPPLVATVPGFA